jgi:opacity protein-like surface antigen
MRQEWLEQRAVASIAALARLITEEGGETMSRRTSLLLAACSLLLVTSMAHAAAGSWSISVGGGLGIPIGDFSRSPDINAPADHGLAGDMGYTVGPAVDYRIDDMFSVGIDGTYAGNKIKSGFRDQLRTNASDPGLDAKFTQMGGGVHGAYWFPMKDSPVSAYLLAGVGMTNFKTKITSSDPTINGDHSKSGFSARVGLGAGYKLSDMATLGLEGDYNFVSIKKDPANTVGFAYNESSVPSMDIKAVVTFNLKGTK